MVQVRFLGHAAFSLEAPGFRGLIDPFLTGNPVASASADSFRELDWIFLTHGHGDHVGDGVALAKRTGAKVVCNFDLAQLLEREGVSTQGMYFAGRTKMPFGWVKMVPAWHGSGFSRGNERVYGGVACGFLLEVGGARIYHAGDTGLTVEMQLLGEEKVDLALLPIGGYYVMDGEDAARAVRLIRPRMVVPMHYDTFPPIQADPEAFRALVGNDAEVRILKPGEALDLP